MRRIVSLTLVMLITICLTGCGSNVLTCKSKEDENTVIKANLKGDSITKIVAESSKVFDSNDDYKDTYESLKESIKEYNESSDKYSYDVKKDDKKKKITRIIITDISKFKQDELEDEFPFELTKKGFIEYAEEAGFTCN